MATQYGLQMGRLRNTAPVDLPMAGDVHGRVRCFNEKVTLASQPTADIIEVARLPKGARVHRARSPLLLLRDEPRAGR